MPDHEDRPSMAELQESDYGDGRDYTYGSPHLAHNNLRRRIESDLARIVTEIRATRGRCRVVEVGAGHGTFTHTLVASGANVVVTEMSEPSAGVLSGQFAGDPRVEVLHDPEGNLSKSAVEGGCDFVVMISVLHHIPDYLGLVEDLVRSMDAGGAFYCTQDPTWYPDRSRLAMVIDRGAYLLWRVGQGNVRRGLTTRIRRLRGVYEDSNPSDMVEYHVVRDGVNNRALVDALENQFETVRSRTFWTTQSAHLQRLGDRLGWQSTFSVIATGRQQSERRPSAIAD